MTDAVDQIANALRVRWVADHAAHPAPYDEDLEASFWRGMASLAVAARDAAVTDDARSRARRLVEAEATVAALTAEVENLKEQATEHLALRDVAEMVLTEVHDTYPRQVYVPGDAEPEFDADRPMMLVGLRDGHVYRHNLNWGDPVWHDLSLSHTGFTWQDVLEQGPCVEITGWGSARLAQNIAEDRAKLTDLRGVVWDLERAATPDYLLREFGLKRDREPAASVAEARAVARNAVVHKLLGQVRGGRGLSETTDETLTRQAGELVRARDLAVAVEAELADLRRAVEAIHVPKQIPSSDPDEGPLVICETCRVDWPCETRSYSDALNPINALDGADLGPDPF